MQRSWRKAKAAEADAITAHQALHMATLGGARALGLDTMIGSIAPGKAADLCAVSLNATELTPCYDPVSHLVYAAGRDNVSDVWVAGRIRVEDRQLLENNEIELIKLAALWQNKIRPRKLS